MIQQTATEPQTAPITVYQIYNSATFLVLVEVDSSIVTNNDLGGKTVGGSASSTATSLLTLLLRADGARERSVSVLKMQPNLPKQVLLCGDIAASLSFTVSSYLNLVGRGQDLDRSFCWVYFSANGLDLCSNVVMVSRTLASDQSGVLPGLLLAIDQALRKVIAGPEAGIADVTATEPIVDGKAEFARFDFMVKRVIVTEETHRLGLGDLDDARLDRSIATIAAAYDLPKKSAASKDFDRSFLPSLVERIMPSVAE